jgi:MFS family permease
VIRRVGHIGTFAAFGGIAATAPLVHRLVVDPFVWIAARALTGFCFAGMLIVVESWLNAGASSGNTGQILSIYGMTGLLAGVGGQASSPGDGSSGLQAVLYHRLHHFARAFADRFDPRRSAGASRGRQPCRPQQALPRLAFRGRGWIPG